MNKIIKLKICNWTLLIIYILTLVSSLQLEIAGNASRLWVILHLIVATSFLAVIVWHIYLHFRWDNWRRLLKGKKKGIIFLIAVVIHLIKHSGFYRK